MRLGWEALLQMLILMGGRALGIACVFKAMVICAKKEVCFSTRYFPLYKYNNFIYQIHKLMLGGNYTLFKFFLFFLYIFFIFHFLL